MCLLVREKEERKKKSKVTICESKKKAMNFFLFNIETYKVKDKFGIVFKVGENIRYAFRNAFCDCVCIFVLFCFSFSDQRFLHRS